MNMIKRAIYLFLFISLSAQADTTEYMCGVQTKDGKFTELEGFSVIDQARKGAIELPSGVKDSTSAVMCWRSSLIPLKGDHKVILLGYPFYIIERSDDPKDSRMIALEYSDDSYQVREVKGSLNEHELSVITAQKLRVVRN
ncbi:hypothetical protein QWY77_11280 [Thalassotalea ponticola]|uniref:hypothetical protein n=1 Tax=Thalassotalea ponticola TaxID=1523392 RepID=UPI0025B41B2D|nr:hypothetical protein [Thalassotalea ponticola]MDN3653322.1 hypothetical protein [Thalassotalea ponticola]